MKEENQSSCEPEEIRGKERKLSHDDACGPTIGMRDDMKDVAARFETKKWILSLLMITTSACNGSAKKERLRRKFPLRQHLMCFTRKRKSESSRRTTTTTMNERKRISNSFGQKVIRNKRGKREKDTQSLNT